MKRLITLFTAQGALAFGVCSTIGASIRLPAWMVRVGVIGLSFLIPELTLIGYGVAAWALHRQKDGSAPREEKFELDETTRRRIEVDTYVHQSEARLAREFEELRRS